MPGDDVIGGSPLGASPGANITTASITDTLSLTDTAGAVGTQDGAGTDGVGLSDSVGAVRVVTASASESLAMAEALHAVYLGSSTDTFSLSESLVLWFEFTETYQDGFRVANDALALYELFVGEDGPPDFTAAPAATSATLPFSWAPTPPASGTKELHLVVRRTNKYGLESFNVFDRVIVINSASVEQLGPLTAPSDVAVYDGATGYIRVVAGYSKADDADPADTWAVYVKVGSDPVPGVDPVTSSTTMYFLGDVTGLAATIGPYSAGAVVHVLVASKRVSDGELGEADVVEHTIASPLTLSEGDLFGGSTFT